MRIRLATPADAGVLIEFNAAMALETEGKELLPDVIGAGVHSLLANPAAGFYVVAERDGPVGSLMITKEWSDWRNGTFWWIQSVYVRPEFRRQGVYKGLYRHVQQVAAKDPGVCGFRLYVERENSRAQTTYGALGMKQTRYLVFEELKPGIRFHR
jgi:ribosomal protein S18 acetylase RimI-like enzyme